MIVLLSFASPEFLTSPFCVLELFDSCIASLEFLAAVFMCFGHHHHQAGVSYAS